MGQARAARRPEGAGAAGTGARPCPWLVPAGEDPMFQQVLDPFNSLFATWVVALIPVAVLLVLLAVFRLSAWLAVLIGSLVTFVLGAAVWKMPVGDGIRAYVYGSLTGVWSVDWITVWGVMLFNTLVVTGVFEKFRRWLIAQGTADVRV